MLVSPHWELFQSPQKLNYLIFGSQRPTCTRKLILMGITNGDLEVLPSVQLSSSAFWEFETLAIATTDPFPRKANFYQPLE